MASCAIDFYITRPSDGTNLRSILFDDLRKLTGNDRELAKKYYFLGTGHEFLSEFGEDAKFDENGEITVSSLIKLAKLNIHEDKILKMLNEEIGAGIQDYNSAIYTLQMFNRTSRFNDDFMATLTPTEDGRYNLQVVKKTARNQEALNNVVMKQSLRDRILYRLRENGVDVEFIEKDGRERGRYSTENAMLTADGLWSLIRIVKGEKVTPTLALEAGHFAIGALGRDPLVQRLEEALTPEVMGLLISNDDVTVLGQDPRREVMGRLVGNAIMNDGNNRNPLFKLAKRIWNKAKRIFYKFVEDDVQQMVMDAKATAEEIALGFMSPDFKGTVENALDYKEVLFDADLSALVLAFKDITNDLKLMTHRMKNIFGSLNRAAWAEFRKIAPDAELNFDINAVNADTQSIDRIAGIIRELSGLMEHSIPNLLNNVDLDDINFMVHAPIYAKNLRAVHAFCNTIGFIDSTIRQLDTDSSINLEIDTGTTRVNLVDMMNDLSLRVKKDLLDRCLKKEYGLFLKYMETFYGKDYVQRSARVIFNFKKRKPGEPSGPILKAIGDEKVPLSKLLNTLDRDISFLDRWMTSMANNPDVVGQIVDKMTKYANKRADDATNYVWDELRKLERMLISGEMDTKDTRLFCEVDDDGNITGNYLSKVKFWKWEEDYHEFLRQSRIKFYVDIFDTLYNTVSLDPRKKAEFDEKLNAAENDTQRMYVKRNLGKQITQTWSSDFRAAKWDEFMQDALEEFHNDHSEQVDVVDPVTGEVLTDEEGNQLLMWVPKDVVYHNSQWDNVMEDTRISEEVRKKRLEFYNKLRSIKMQCDQYLPINANKVYRMPMFRGTFVERMKNRMKVGESGGATFVGAMASNMRENIINAFTINSDDTEYGTALTYNTTTDTEDNLFEDQLAALVDLIERVPFFGINKLRDRNLQRRNQIRRLEHEQENGNFDNAELLKQLKRMSTNEVSTDLLQSMLAYASMAHTYGSMSSIVDVLEVGRSVLQQRDVNSVKNRKPGRRTSKAYERYSAYMEKQVYGIGVGVPKWDKYGIARKLAQGLSSFASKVFLGGNLAGGIVNTGTGAIELFKEAVAGQFFDAKEFALAYNIYRKCGFDSIIHAGAEFKQDDVSLIIRHFNILGDIRQRHRDWDTSNKAAIRTYNLLLGSSWAPYKTGEHFMLSMSYIMALLHNHVIDKDGNKISLMNMYKQNIISEEVNGKKMKKIMWDKYGGFYRESRDEDGNIKHDEVTYYNDTTDEVTGLSAREASTIAKSILDRLEGQVQLDPSERIDIFRFLSDEEKDFLKKHDMTYKEDDGTGVYVDKMDVSLYEKFKIRLENFNDRMIWSQRDESDLMDKCREINDRMHGIYNRLDKVAFLQNIIGNMILTMRGYALGMAARRFSSDRYNVATGSDFEGSAVTMAKAFASLFSFSEFEDMSDAEKRHARLTTIRALLFPYSIRNSNIKEEMMKLGWSEALFANLRRNNMDFLIISALAILKLLSAADIGAGEDEDLKKRIAELKDAKKRGEYVQPGLLKELQDLRKALADKKRQAMNNRTLGMIHYLTARWLREQTAFNTPGGMNLEGNQLLEWKPAGYSVFEEMVNTAYLGIGAMFADKHNSKFFYQRDDNAGDRYKQYDTKFALNIWRYFPYYRTYKFVLRRPYDALKSYEYNFDR